MAAAKTKKVTDNLVFNNARIVFRNFTGRAGRFNAEGIRSFSVVIEDLEFAHKLEEDGWNIKWPKPREDGEELAPTLPVAVSFDPYPPRIKQVQEGGGEVWLDASNVFTLDDAEIISASLVIRPYNYEVNGSTGVKAYLKDMKVEVARDIFCD